MKILRLLEIGIPWDFIRESDEEEIEIALGVKLALLQKMQDEIPKSG